MDYVQLCLVNKFTRTRICYGKKQKLMHYVVSRGHDHFISREQDIFLELIWGKKGICTTKGNFDNKVYGKMEFIIRNKEEKMKFSRDRGNIVPPLEVARASKALLLISNHSFTKRKSSEIKLTFDWLRYCPIIFVWVGFRSISIELNPWIEIQLDWIRLAMPGFINWCAVHNYTWIPRKILITEHEMTNLTTRNHRSTEVNSRTCILIWRALLH